MRKPKSRGRNIMDAVLFGALAVLFLVTAFWRIDIGEISLRRGSVVRLSENPTEFWIWIAVHGLIVLVCAGLSVIAVRGALRSEV
jgi:hypothetical protein